MIAVKGDRQALLWAGDRLPGDPPPVRDVLRRLLELPVRKPNIGDVVTACDRLRCIVNEIER